jgi:hypothetical protein
MPCAAWDLFATQPACSPAIEDRAMTDTIDILYRELDHRITDRIEVRLLWCPFDDTLHVTVFDARTSTDVTIPVRDRSRARDVFLHPFVYAPATPETSAAAA